MFSLSNKIPNKVIVQNTNYWFIELKLMTS